MPAPVEVGVASSRHRAELTAYCQRMLGCTYEAEDAVQETFLRAWRASARFEGRASLRTWLYRIATNVCLDALGRSARAPQLVEGLPEPEDAESAPDPSDRAIEREWLRFAIMTAIRVLPPRQRAVLVLRDVLSWRAAEVADLLDMTPAGVNSALQRARAALELIDPERLPAATGAPSGAIVGRYMSAFADDDVDALVALSRDELAVPQPDVVSVDVRGR
jgi:RNA polymerase sigma-70 factor, ECF subfamily